MNRSSQLISNGARYLRAVQDLRQDAVPGRWTSSTNRAAPHKPLLLISVLDEFIERPGRQNLIEPTLKLETLFDWYWQQIIQPAHDTTMALPFFHLANDGFWHLVPLAAKEHELESPRIRKSTAALREVVRGARLDEELYALLSDHMWAQHLRSVIIATHFIADVHYCFFSHC